jgi:hypothetical protein
MEEVIKRLQKYLSENGEIASSLRSSQ